MGWLWFGLAYVVAHLVVGWQLAANAPARDWFGTLTMLVPPLVLVGVVVARRRDWAGCVRLFWGAVGAGALLWAVGHLGWTLDVVVFNRAYPWLAWHTLLTLAGSAMLAVAVLTRPHLTARFVMQRALLQEASTRVRLLAAAMQ